MPGDPWMWAALSCAGIAVAMFFATHKIIQQKMQEYSPDEVTRLRKQLEDKENRIRALMKIIGDRENHIQP
jgi:SMC interacting uncharacterized protein involved in chromosome segregation